MELSDNKVNDFNWRTLYRLGGVTALAVVLTGIAEIGITFLPGGSTPATTVVEWFNQYQASPFIGLRNMGLLNIIMTLLGMPVTLALYGAHRRVNKPFAGLALIISFVGVATFFATNRAFPLLDLSRQYAAATTDAQRLVLMAAGQSLLAVGQSHTAGTFLAFFLSEIAGLTMSIVVLRGKVFGPATGIVGILSNSCFLVFEVSASFFTGLSPVVMALAVCGGLLSFAWNILVALRLFQLGRAESEGLS